MRHALPGLAALLLSALLPGCGGGGGGDMPAPSPPAPPPASKVTLGATNYQNAVKVSMGTAVTALGYARLGIGITDHMINVPVTFFPVPCPASGSMSTELTDQNRDTTFDPGDTVHLRWDHCKAASTTITGLIRVELTDAVQIPGGREYFLTLTVSNLEIVRDAAGIPPVTVNFLASIHLIRKATSEETVITSAAFSSGQIAGDTGTSELFVDYLQDYALQSYSYSAHGKVVSGGLGGEIDFTTPGPFTGVLGEYPAEGRMSVEGNASSNARLSEEGAAAGSNDSVLMSVDTNGDGVADNSDAQAAWNSVMPVQFFTSFESWNSISVPLP